MVSQEDLQSRTWLSEREAELLVLTEEYDSLGDIAEEMDIKESTAQTVNQRIREKKRKSERTIELIEEVRT